MNRRILVEMATNEESEIFAQEPVASVPLPVTVFPSFVLIVALVL